MRYASGAAYTRSSPETTAVGLRATVPPTTITSPVTTAPVSRIASPLMTSSVPSTRPARSEEHTSELQSQSNLVCRLLLEKKKKKQRHINRSHDHHQVRW